MNLQFLLDNFETMAESPKARTALNSLILELAVNGKLIGNDVSDAASSVDAHITQPPQRPTNQVSGNEQPHLLPVGWYWCRLGDLFERVQNGTSAKQTKSVVADSVAVTRIETISQGVIDFGRVGYVRAEKTLEKHRLEKGDILLSHINSDYHIGKTAIYDSSEELYHGVNLLRLTPKPDVAIPRFVQVVIEWLRWSGAFLKVARHAIGQASINQTVLKDMIVPLAPLHVQDKIVTKVDELMALIDRYETAKNAREESRKAFRDSALQALQDAEGADEVHKAWKLVSDNIDEMFVEPEDVDSLRQTVLSLAVEGKLVRQQSSDIPSEVLLQEISRLCPGNSRRRSTGSSSVVDSDEDRSLPNGWELVRFPDIADWAIGSGFPKQYQGHVDKKFMFCKVGDMNREGNERFINTTANTIDEAIKLEAKVKTHPAGTVIFPKIGGAIATNKRRILKTETAIDNNCLGLAPYPGVTSDWLFVLLSSIDLSRYQSGTSVPALSQSVLDTITFGLPPTEEQQRIVAKVEELMVLCDDLESGLDKSLTEADMIANSLRSAFAISAP